MYLSFGLEYFGDCSSALDFYESVFENVSVERKPYREMDIAKALSVTGSGLDMIWQSSLRIPCADSVLCMEMSDSLMSAM